MDDKIANAVNVLLSKYPIIAGDDDLPLEARAGYLTAAVRVDDSIRGLDYLPNGNLFRAILEALTTRTHAGQSSAT